jgi:hypothetical protein
MLKHFLAALLLTTVVTGARSGFAVTLRYALVIGNNIGVDADGNEPFPPLVHAEREASRLKKQLVEVSHFDPSSKRTKLLLSATRGEVTAAFKALSKQRQEDSRLFDNMESIFLLYYTGHGLSRRLLLSDGPLPAATLTNLFSEIGADFSVGVFDACYSGSLDNLLKEKGIRPTRGLNMAKNLPEEVLSAKGSIWYVSSGAGEPSYEDKNIGGVFTHFFIEALASAEPSGPGITLDSIWKYAREKTVAYTAGHNRHQIPEQFVAKLRAKAPIYFSFPSPRSASLILSENLGGKFALSYGDGHLVEVFEKPKGRQKKLSVYPGKARLMVLDVGSKRPSHPIRFTPGNTVVIHTMPEPLPPLKMGEQYSPLFTKGTVSPENEEVSATAIASGPSWMTGVGYGATFAINDMLHPRHRFFIPLRVDIPRFTIEADGVFGMDTRKYATWSYDALLAGGLMRGAYRFDVGRFAPSVGLGVSFAHIWQQYKDVDSNRTGWQVHPQVTAGAVFPRTGKWFVALQASVGPLYAPGAAAGASSAWHVAGGVGLTGYFRVY